MNPPTTCKLSMFNVRSPSCYRFTGSTNTSMARPTLTPTIVMVSRRSLASAGPNHRCAVSDQLAVHMAQIRRGQGVFRMNDTEILIDASECTGTQEPAADD